MDAREWLLNERVRSLSVMERGLLVDLLCWATVNGIAPRELQAQRTLARSIARRLAPDVPRTSLWRAVGNILTSGALGTMSGTIVGQAWNSRGIPLPPDPEPPQEGKAFRKEGEMVREEGVLEKSPKATSIASAIESDPLGIGLPDTAPPTPQKGGASLQPTLFGGEDAERYSDASDLVKVQRLWSRLCRENPGRGKPLGAKDSESLLYAFLSLSRGNLDEVERRLRLLFADQALASQPIRGRLLQERWNNYSLGVLAEKLPPDMPPPVLPPDTSSIYRAAKVLWDAVWEERVGKPFFWSTKHYVGVAEAVKAAEGDLEELERRMRALVFNPTPFMASNASPAFLASRWNELAQEPLTKAERTERSILDALNEIPTTE